MKPSLIPLLQRYNGWRVWLLFALGITLSTELIVSLMGLLLKGEVSADYLLTGFVTAAIVAPLSLSLLSHLLQELSRQEKDALLVESRGFLRTIIDSAPIRVFWKDRNLRYQGCNLAFVRDAGKDHEKEIIGKDDYQMVWADRAASYRADDQRVMESGVGKIAYEEVQTLPDGREVWVRTSKVPLRNHDQEAIGIIGIYEDITEYKQAKEAMRESEARYRLLADHVSDVLWVMNIEKRRTVYVSPSVERLRGYSVEEVLGQSLEETMTGESYAKVSAWIPERTCLFLNGALDVHVYVDEIEQTRKDGSSVLTEVATRYIRNEQGELILLGVSRDISARKKAENDLVVAKAAADKANNAKSRFLAAASHDLRQPLSALSLYVGVLKKKASPDNSKLVANIQDCVDSLSEMLSDILDVSKLEAGVVRAKISDFAIDGLLASLVSLHSAEAAIKGLRLRSRSSRTAVRTDQQLLFRMLGNLVANAIRYTEKGGVLIACRRHQGRQWVEIWDTGMGIPEDKIDIIFEEFRQLGDEARSRGSGLGLAIVAKTAALLNLQLRLRSRPGRGSMFAIELPPGRKSPFPELPDAAPAARNMRIAVVEDNRKVLDALALALKSTGHEVIAATSGSVLFESMGNLAPDMLISDFRLGSDETGFDVIATARYIYDENLPAMIVTGDTDPALLRSMADRGIGVCHKPLKIEVLLEFIRAATERRSS